MVMSWIWTVFLGLSIAVSINSGSGAALGAAALEGAKSAVNLTIAMAGSICLWSGIGKLVTHIGLTRILSRLLQPLLYHVFPSTREDTILASHLSANITANFLGLGNAATPMGIAAAKRLKRDEYATDELCRLIVLITASIQLIPANVAAVRASLGCSAPFDILPAVWITSLCSTCLGVCGAFILGRIRKK